MLRLLDHRRWGSSHVLLEIHVGRCRKLDYHAVSERRIELEEAEDIAIRPEKALDGSRVDSDDSSVLDEVVLLHLTRQRHEMRKDKEGHEPGAGFMMKFPPSTIPYPPSIIPGLIRPGENVPRPGENI